MLPLNPSVPIAVCAVNLSDRLDTRPLRVADALAPEPLALAVEGGGMAVLFRFGAAVFFGVTPQAQAKFIQKLAPHLVVPAFSMDREETTLQIHPGALVEGPESGGLVLHELELGKLLIIAGVLGKSVALAALETRVAHAFEHVEPLAGALGREGRLPDDQHALFRHIGRALLVEHAMVARVRVNEKPDILWDAPGLEGLYLRLESEYELADRGAILDRRVDLLSRTAGTVLGLAQHRASLRVEWYVIALIIFEIVLMLWTMRPGH